MYQITCYNKQRQIDRNKCCLLKRNICTYVCERKIINAHIIIWKRSLKTEKHSKFSRFNICLICFEFFFRGRWLLCKYSNIRLLLHIIAVLFVCLDYQTVILYFIYIVMFLYRTILLNFGRCALFCTLKWSKNVD